jgi:hypothetical protein
MAKAPPCHELEFLKLTQNHGEFSKKLDNLGFASAGSTLSLNAQHICLCWFQLAREHLRDARTALKLKRCARVV